MPIDEHNKDGGSSTNSLPRISAGLIFLKKLIYLKDFDFFTTVSGHYL